MAVFTNQATLTYSGGTTNSNIAYGEILEVLSATKTAVEDTYAPNQLVTYAITLRNTGTGTFTGLTLTDNLGGYDFEGETVYPLSYEEGSVLYIQDGIPQPAPTVTAGPPLTISGITVPSNGNVVVIYQARATMFASPEPDGSITNTVTVTGGGLTSPITAEETISAVTGPMLTITKTITPNQVVDNGRVTYSFLIQNTGNEAVVATDDAAITDIFDPILTDLVVILDGTVLVQGTDYTYNEVTGLFQTVPGRITVPAATFTQDPSTGEYTMTAGMTTLTVTGTI